MAVIPSVQFANLYGGSRRLADMTEGPSHGYYVARDPDVPVREGGSYEARVENGLAHEVQAHYDLVKEEGAMHALPTHPAHDVYQGTWGPEGEPRFLDVSDRYPESTRGLMHALQHGMANAQWAGWRAHGPAGDKQEFAITDPAKGPDGEVLKDEHGESVKGGVNPRAKYVADALHAQEVQRAVSSRPAKTRMTKNQRDRGA